MRLQLHQRHSLLYHLLLLLSDGVQGFGKFRLLLQEILTRLVKQLLEVFLVCLQSLFQERKCSEKSVSKKRGKKISHFSLFLRFRQLPFELVNHRQGVLSLLRRHGGLLRLHKAGLGFVEVSSGGLEVCFALGQLLIQTAGFSCDLYDRYKE